MLPSLTLGMLGAGWYARMMRSSMIDVLRQDYIRTARAKGLARRAILFRHALPNAILPVIAMIGIDIGLFMGGIVVVESVFGWPGIGQLAWQAIQRVDIPIIMGVTLVSACAIVHRQPARRHRRAVHRSAHQAQMNNDKTPEKGNTSMKRFLASTVAASALALMLAMHVRQRGRAIDPNAKQGGAITITYKDDVATLDPAIGYDWQNWSMIKSLFDGLMDYEPGTTDAQARPRRELRDLAGRQDLHLQAAPRRQIPQRPRDDRRRREILARPRHQPEDAEPRRRLLRLDQGL